MEHNKPSAPNVPLQQEHCQDCRTKHTPRDPALKRQLTNRLSRVAGQLEGMKRMLEQERYCGDILIQLAAAERALEAFGRVLLKDHMHTCVAEEMNKGNQAALDELMELMEKLK